MSEQPVENDSMRLDLAFSAVGAVVGGLVGYFLFSLILRSGLYAIVLPGALAGVVGGALLKKSSNVMGVFAAGIALVVTVYTEWRFFPFIADDSLGYFMRHVHTLPGMKQVLMAAGVLTGFWFGRGRDRV